MVAVVMVVHGGDLNIYPNTAILHKVNSGVWRSSIFMKKALCKRGLATPKEFSYFPYLGLLVQLLKLTEQ